MNSNWGCLLNPSPSIIIVIIYNIDQLSLADSTNFVSTSSFDGPEMVLACPFCIRPTLLNEINHSTLSVYVSIVLKLQSKIAAIPTLRMTTL